MVVLSVGMRKSGSGWYFNLTNDLLVMAGFDDVRAVKDDPVLAPALKGEVNVKLGRATWPQLLRFARAHYAGRTFALKSHAGPTLGVRWLVHRGIIKPTYIYRDPRDVVLSALDHARATRATGEHIDLSSLHNVEDALEMVKRELRRWDQWMRFNRVLVVRYEDLVADTLGELQRLVHYLAIDLRTDQLEALVRRYDKATYRTTSGIDRKIHLNKGVPGRFKEEMTREERLLCERHLGDHLARMGYA